MHLRPIELVLRVNAPPYRVWAEIADLGAHSEWMRDAEAIRFLTEHTVGVGTRFEVPTRVGPFRTNDVMTVVEWEEGKVLAVQHHGAVTGIGRFELQPTDTETMLHWSEDLRFPWWLGGVVGARVAAPVLRQTWRRNLERFRARVELSDP